ncbi:unnamed protein product [Prunus armeniaca]|uniref:Uncharacterized protein n=1 Tax=Prunus armeniaca TaxID=36596 RepID=A0A6J5UWU4_PRUAR|nr:unnamed protein product [Prunus armeniaca]
MASPTASEFGLELQSLYRITLAKDREIHKLTTPRTQLQLTTRNKDPDLCRTASTPTDQNCHPRKTSRFSLLDLPED